MPLPKLVIFDWDGTLVDSIEPILKGFELAYGRAGHPCPPADRLRGTIGLPLAVAFEQLTPGLPSAAMATLYREYWFDPQRPPSPWAAGAVEVLDWLDERRVVSAIATGKSRDGLEHELAALDVRHRFAATRSANDAPPKPHPEMLRQILHELAVEAHEAVMIGDNPMDLAMGRGAGVATFGVLGGVGSLDALEAEGPRAVLEDLRALMSLLQELDS